MKPEWKDAPEWANYLAMDMDGEWIWFERYPTLCKSDYFWMQNEGRYRTAYRPTLQWEKSLEERPNE